MTARTTVGADRPLVDPGEDVLGYAPFAKQLAHTLLRNSPADGFVIAIYGAWGTGKSTALNFVVHYMEEDADADAPVIVRFNPWWFAGSEDLTRRFFAQFESAVFAGRAKKRKLKSTFEKFASAVGEVPFAPVQAAGKLAAAAVRATAVDVVKLKEELSAELAKEALRIVVVMDDIDRLVADEVRQLFRLIKAVADFPNVTYLLAFDREVAANALGEVHEGRGDAYLEKIVQAPFELPPPDRTQLQSLLLTRIGEVLGEIPDAQFDQVYWGNVFVDGVDPFVKKPRDIVRLVNALTVTFPAVKGEVNVVDFVALETLRVLCPIAYEVVRSNQKEFAGATSDRRHGQEERARALAFHEGWMKALGDQRPQVQRLLVRLFPRLESVWGNTVYSSDSLLRWRRAMRACSPEVFTVYFRLSVASGAISNTEFDAAIADEQLPALAGRLRQLASEKLPDGTTRARTMLDRLNDYARDEASGATARAAAIVRALFDAGDDVIALDGGQASFLNVDDELRVHFVVRNLLRRLSITERVTLMTDVVRNGRSLGVVVREVARMAADLGRYGGKLAQPEDQLLASDDVDALETLVKERAGAAATDGGLWKLPDLLITLGLWRRMGDDGGVDRWLKNETVDDVRLVRVLEHFLGWRYSHGISDRVSRRTARVSLKNVEAFFNLDELVARLKRLPVGAEWTQQQQLAVRLIVQGYERRVSGERDPLEDFE